MRTVLRLAHLVAACRPHRDFQYNLFGNAKSDRKRAATLERFLSLSLGKIGQGENHAY
jgi:hypothetical protein